jgi:hypothetical protein
MQRCDVGLGKNLSVHKLSNLHLVIRLGADNRHVAG